ncbi:hypothetical protein BCR35DRAFT_254694, partial [Leucosporidium creatinivorum]
APFLEAIDPNVHWQIAGPERQLDSAQGIFNVAEWKELINKPLLARLDSNGLKMAVESVDVIGQRAIVECSGTATQKNGKPYNNFYCWIFHFSEETGKVVKIYEYLNTHLVYEVSRDN